MDAVITRWAEARDPFFAGANADWLALLPFAVLTVFLYLVGRELLLNVRRLNVANSASED